MEHLESRTEKIDIRGLRYNVRHWGPADAPPLFFLHGWMDCSPTFQFLVDALRQSWHVIAPDWRGYGESEWLSRAYWFPDYYADLHCLLDHYSPGRPAKLLGHSMGANIASIYAGIAPQRVAQLVMVDFLGLKPAADEDSPTLLGKWIDNVQHDPRMGIYQDRAALASRLMALNPRLSGARAAFLSSAVARLRSDGRVQMACDPWHRIASPTVYRVEDALASWRRIEAPVLLLTASHGLVNQRFGNDSLEYSRRTASFRNFQCATIPEAGHNLQHDQPELAAAAIERFFSRG